MNKALRDFYKKKGFFFKESNVIHAEKLFFIDRAFGWVQGCLREKKIDDVKFSQYVLLLMAYNEGEVELRFNEQGNLTFVMEEGTSNDKEN
jgi:hypothetical protein